MNIKSLENELDFKVIKILKCLINFNLVQYRFEVNNSILSKGFL